MTIIGVCAWMDRGLSRAWVAVERIQSPDLKDWSSTHLPLVIIIWQFSALCYHFPIEMQNNVFPLGALSGWWYSVVGGGGVSGVQWHKRDQSQSVLPLYVPLSVSPSLIPDAWKPRMNVSRYVLGKLTKSRRPERDGELLLWFYWFRAISAELRGSGCSHRFLLFPAHPPPAAQADTFSPGSTSGCVTS